MATELEGRFRRFLSSLPASEEIDQLQLPPDPQRRRKADFLLANREVIVEFKTLSVDTSTKIEPAVKKHREREEFPLFFGKADLRKVLAHLPDGEDIYRRIYLAITRSVEQAVRSAEEQISHTRHVLGLPHAAGMLAILNESVQVLDPTVVGHRIAKLMRRKRTGRSASETLDFAWLIFESHTLGGTADFPVFPSILIRGERADNYPWFNAFMDDVFKRWASFSGAAFIDGGSPPDPNALKYIGVQELRKPFPTKLPRQEVWRRQYKSRPYLRNLSDTEVLEHGGKIIHRLMPYVIKGGPGFVAEVVIPLMEQFTHFLEEASHRALDLRNIPKP